MTKGPVKAYIRDGIYIPIKFVKPEHEDMLPSRFEKLIFHKEKTCEGCDYYSERPCDVCESCANFGGNIKLHRFVTKGDKEYLKLPYGGVNSVKKIFGEDTKLIYKLDEIPMAKKIKFTATLKDYQVPACQAIIANYGGVLKSAPRTGKTVMSAYAICKMGMKTLILAAQRDWLENFYETFVGSDTQPAMTNASKKRIGFAKKFEEFEKYDIALATYQTFLSDKGQKLLKKIKRMFSVIVVDEVQTVPATEFSVMISKMESLYKIGLSGTPERKDSKEWVAYKLMGPVFYETEVERLRPKIELTKTELAGKLPSSWTYMVAKLEKDPARLKLIAKQALKDVKAGHLVLIPLARVDVIRALTKAINLMAGKTIAAEFYGGVNKEKRKWVIEKARNYKFKVVVGNTRLLSTGINIPRASALYEVTPSSNQPKAEQRFSRVLTPMADKPQPIIRYFLDDVDVRRSCMRSEFFQTLWPKFKPIIRGDIKDDFFNYLNNKRKNTERGVSSYTGGRI